jgi:hypothetical protein
VRVYADGPSARVFARVAAHVPAPLCHLPVPLLTGNLLAVAVAQGSDPGGRGVDGRR